MATITLRVRQAPDQPWFQNFTQGGWKLRDNVNSSWIDMTPANTKVRSSDNTTWLDPE